jgi:dienelactone hydrolase
MRRFLIAISLLSAATSAEPIIKLPVDINAPSPAAIRISGLAPEATVIVVGDRRDTDGKTEYRATATFRSDEGGVVDLGRDPALEGDYRGVDPIGIFWAARALNAASDAPPPGSLRVTATIHDTVVATATTGIMPDPGAIEQSSDTPFPGAVWARPTAPGIYPVIILLGGSEGGAVIARVYAPVFAARGYAVLGLPYYSPAFNPDKVPGLPTSFIDIPVDRLAAVHAWLRQRSGVNLGRIGIWGGSMGAEFALIAATKYRWIRAVAAIVPSDVVTEGWGTPGPARPAFSWHGKPLPFQPYDGMDREIAKAARGLPMDFRRAAIDGRLAHPERLQAARIPVERYTGGLLVAGGGCDGLWPSMESAQAISHRRARAGLRTTLLMFPLADHYLFGPGTAPLPPNGSSARSERGQAPDPAATANGRAETWAATLAFFDENLKPDDGVH